MSPLREPISHELSHEQPHRAEASTESLFQKARKKGQIDLSQFSKDEQKTLYGWYAKNIDTLPHDDRMEFLEQCIANKVIHDKQLLTHIEPLFKTLEEPKNDVTYNDAKLSLRTLGEYLAFMKNPAYRESLWECWSEISYETQRDLIHYCTREKPELAILVAPFTDMSRLYVFTSKKTGKKTEVVYKSRVINARDIYYQNREKDEEERSFIGMHFEHFEDAKPYIESLVSYCEKHREKLYPDSPAVENLRAINRVFLFPYLKKIEECKIEIFPKKRWVERDLREEKDGIQPFLEKGNIPYCNSKNFLTKNEREELERLRKEFIKRNPKMAERLKSDESCLLAIQENLPPERNRRALMKIIDTGTIRAVHTILDSFQEYKHHLSEKEQKEFLLECLAKRYPVFAVIDKLGISKEAVADLFKKAARQEFGFPLNDLSTNRDISTLLTFNKEHPGEPDLERLMVNALIKDVSSSVYNAGFERFMTYQSDTILPLFSQENQTKIIQALDKYCPEFWMKNIPFALTHSSVPFHTLLNSLDGYHFFKYYHSIMYHAQQVEKKGIHTSVTIHDIRHCARTYILHHSWAFFDHPQIVKENFSQKEQQDYIESRLTPPVQSRFFLTLLDSPFKDTYREYCKKIIEKDRGLRDACMRSYYSGSPIKELIGTKKILHYALEKMDSDVELVKKIFDDREICGELFQSQSSIAICLKKIQETKSYDLAIDLLQTIHSALSTIEYAKKTKQKISSNIPAARLKALETIFQDAVREGCEKDPFLIFHRDIRKNSQLNPKERIQENADVYFLGHPEELLEHEWRDTKFFYEELLGSETFSLLINRHMRTLAFSERLSSEVIALFEEDTQKRLMSINPSLLVLSQERLDGDFYDAIFSEIQHSAFFPLYEKRLREIASGEMELYGRQEIPKDITIPDEWKELTKRIALLENTVCARENVKYFLHVHKKQRDRILQTLAFLAANNLDGELSFDSKKESIEELVSKIHARIHVFFEDVFDLRSEDFTHKKLDTFSLEGIGALSVYYKKTCSTYPKMKAVLQECISHAMSGTYKSWKLPDTNRLPELQKNNLLPQNLSPEQYDAWKKEDTLNLEDIIQYDIASIHFGIREVLDQAIADGHIDPALLSQSVHELQHQYVSLTQPLQKLVDRQKELQTYSRTKRGDAPFEHQEEYEELKHAIARYMADHKTELARIKALQYLGALKKISAGDLEEKILATEEKKRIPFSEIFKTIHIALQQDFPLFMSDAARIQSILSEGRQNIFSGERVSKTQLFMTDRIDLETYARIGEKPVTSCQHYNSDGSHDYNRGLLSYLIDPNVKIIQVYDADKKIIARAILRLMQTHTGDPVLFAERIYSANSHPKINEAIERYVAKKAEGMAIPYALSGKPSFSEPLFQNGSRSPFVYTDAGGGVVPNGMFEIEPTATLSFHFKGPDEVDNSEDTK